MRLVIAVFLSISIFLTTNLALASGWSDVDASIARDIRAGAPLVVRVIVPLCDNALIDCGSSIAGKPSDLEHNVYWGASFGQRHFFERKKSGWTRLELSQSKAPYLERAVFQRRVDGVPWGKPAGETIEEIVVLDAVDGTQIDRAVDDFQKLAAKGGRVSIQDGSATRDLRVMVAGYAGHNRLMDGKKLAKLERSESAIPAFVLACESEQYWGTQMRASGSDLLVTTRTLMAPEAYVVEAIAQGLGENVAKAEVRKRAVDAYAKWQKLSDKAASSVFAK
jgi:hypothetical protein